AELLTRYFKYEDETLDEHLQSIELDIIQFDTESNELFTINWEEVDLEELLGIIIDEIIAEILEWLDFEELATESEVYTETGESNGETWEISFQESDSDSTILEGYTYDYLSNGDSIFIDFFDDSITSFIEATGLSFSSRLETTMDSITGLTEFGDTTPYDQSLSLTLEEGTLDWLGAYENGKNTYTESLDIGNDNMDFFLFIEDEGYYENLTANGIDEEGNNFDFWFSGDKTDGAYESWTYEATDETVRVDQVIQDDSYYEFIGYAPNPYFYLDMTYNDADFVETFTFDNEEGTSSIQMEMTPDSLAETFTHSDENSWVWLDFGLDSIDGTMMLYGDDGDNWTFEFADSVLVTSTNTMFEDDSIVEVTYSDTEDGGNIVGVFYENAETEGITLFNDLNMYEHGIELSNEKFNISSEEIDLENSFSSIYWPTYQDSISLAWNTESSNGSMLFNEEDEETEEEEGGLGDFTGLWEWGESEEEVEEADEDEDEWHWRKRLDLTLDPTRIITGEQEGEVKGYGAYKRWLLIFHPEDANLYQEGRFHKGPFEKDWDADISLTSHYLRQRMKLSGTFGGTTVEKDNETVVEDGEVEGEQDLNLDNDDLGFGKDMHGTYGSNSLFRFRQDILWEPPSWNGLRKTLGIDNEGEEIEIDQFISIPLEGDCWKWRLGLGGHYSPSNGATGGGRITGESCEGWILDGGIHVGPDGEIEGDFGIGWSW
ncbi:MAG: hypothetical protein Q8P27_01645, partial [Candidatus Peregrinibacteria bacterium]|nr:hypothetical protein [Candidatus Peregrinibacteria bacterium]